MPKRKRAKPARGAFEAKVLLLEQWVVAGHVPANTPIFRTVKDVRDWVDPARGLRSWTSHSVVAPNGLNPDLRIRLDLVLPRLVGLQGGSRRQKGVTTSVRKNAAEKEIAEERRVLAAQNDRLICANAKLERQLANEKVLRAKVEAERDDIRRTLSTLIPMRQVIPNANE